MIIIEIVYVVSAFLLALLGFNTVLLSLIYLLHQNQQLEAPSQDHEDGYPKVVVQLPIYNERHVVERLIDAVSQLDYPRDRLVIQLLDDSTDDTVLHAAIAVETAREKGMPIVHIRREDRTGYKAGALNYGLRQTDAEFIAVFDADFAPRPDFLRRVMPYFLDDARLGMLQTRWAHLNANYSLLTRAQALALDSHFVVEQTARNRGHLMMNFAGTGGVWRRKCIETSGGWQTDTLSEDIDLSYRAQLEGWHCLYLPNVDTPAEIPPLMMGFKRQQARWATGTIQCMRKLGLRILVSKLNPLQKLEAFLHLGGYFAHPLMLLVLVLTLPLLWTNRLTGLPLAGLGFAMLGMPSEIILSQQYLYKNWAERLLMIPMLLLIGMGIAVSNTEALFKGLSGRPVSFARTPKFQIDLNQPHKWAESNYVLPMDHTTWLELIFCLYALITFIVALEHHAGAAMFMGLYTMGFASVAFTSLWQTWAAQQRRALRKNSWSFSGSD